MSLEKGSFTFRSLLAPFAAGSALSVVRLGIGLVRIKYLALVFGAAGVGLLSQANQLQLMGVMLVSLSLNTGLTQRLLSAAREGDPHRERRALPTVLTVQAACACVLLAAALLLRKPLAALLFGEGGYSSELLLVAASVPFVSLASNYLESLFFGHDRYDLYIRASITSSLLGFAVFLPLAHFGGLRGVFVAYVAAACIHLGSYVYYLRALRRPAQLFRFGIDREELAALASFSGLMMVVSFATCAFPIAMRAVVIRAKGLEDNGVLQVPVALSAYYSPFITNLLWGKLHPRTGALGDTPRAHGEIHHVMQFVVLLQAFFAVGLLCLPELLVGVFYTRDFSRAVGLLPYQLAGDFFYFIAFTVGVCLMALGRARAYLAGWLSYFVVFFTVSYLFLPGLGIEAVPIGHLCASFLVFLPAALWLARRAPPGGAGAQTAAWILGCGAAVSVQAALILAGVPREARALSGALLFLAAGLVVLRKWKLRGAEQG